MDQAVHVINAFDYISFFIESLQGREEQYWSLAESRLFLVFYMCVCMLYSLFNYFYVVATHTV